MQHIFVYGTLMDMYPDGIEATVQGHVLYNLMAFPAAVSTDDPADEIKGMVYSLPALPQDRFDTLRRLDAYESVPDLYIRKQAEAHPTDGSDPIPVWMYEYAHPAEIESDFPVIPNGDWHNARSR